MKLVLVYAGSPDSELTQSPYSITKNLYYFLKERVNVEYHNWDSVCDVQLNDDDIVLGHPNYDDRTIIQHIFKQNQKCRVKCLIHPLHTVMINDNLPFDGLARAADHIFSICGPYWIDTIDSTPFAHWKPKITRLDMAVDLNIWPYRKTTFNEPGYRKILYVGSSTSNKNLGLLAEIIKSMPDVNFEWYGGSDDHPIYKLPNTYVEGWQQFSNDKMVEICGRNDLFISTSISDANPTTLLEFGLASGLIPICTESSGYWKDECFSNIPLNAIGAVEIIREWLNKPSQELVERSRLNRKVCEEKYTWERFCQTIWSKLEAYL